MPPARNGKKQLALSKDATDISMGLGSSSISFSPLSHPLGNRMKCFSFYIHVVDHDPDLGPALDYDTGLYVDFSFNHLKRDKGGRDLEQLKILDVLELSALEARILVGFINMTSLSQRTSESFVV
ncbi:hypothetical protein EVAR_51560_1 [Eumeta japonica]|uniref:Uncharacterized protein n=1 Tax=Eumeta variegata TaxID=151549 RepID=A0A4C1YJ60_EUMVA|nr:hypothetical protein EVAR_51560_1 [Eumeta japonica]